MVTMTLDAAPTPLDLLSAGAVKTLVAALAAALGARTGTEVRVAFDTAPTIKSRLASGERPDLVAAPRALIDGLAGQGVLAARAPLMSVGVGLVGRAGVVAPDISTEAALRDALAGAAAVVVNRASTALYIDALMARLGLGEALADRVIRLANGREVMEHMAHAPAGHIGFGATTEIEVHRSLGVHVAAELPAALRNDTTYDLAALATESRAFIDFVRSAEADGLFAACHAARAPDQP